MEEQIISHEELVSMFRSGELKDDNQGWLLNGMSISIIALHDLDVKYVHDMAKAQHYKLIIKEK